MVMVRVAPPRSMVPPVTFRRKRALFVVSDKLKSALIFKATRLASPVTEASVLPLPLMFKVVPEPKAVALEVVSRPPARLSVVDVNEFEPLAKLSVPAPDLVRVRVFAVTAPEKLKTVPEAVLKVCDAASVVGAATVKLRVAFAMSIPELPIESDPVPALMSVLPVVLPTIRPVTVKPEPMAVVVPLIPLHCAMSLEEGATPPFQLVPRSRLLLLLSLEIVAPLAGETIMPYKPKNGSN